jgi:hypothetical protein
MQTPDATSAVVQHKKQNAAMAKEEPDSKPDRQRNANNKTPAKPTGAP